MNLEIEEKSDMVSKNFKDKLDISEKINGILKILEALKTKEYESFKVILNEPGISEENSYTFNLIEDSFKVSKAALIKQLELRLTQLEARYKKYL